MKAMSGRKLLFLGIAVLVLATPAPIHAWQMDSGELKRIPLPYVLRPSTVQTLADFDGDSQREKLTLAEDRARIWDASQLVWQSPKSWRVDQARITDLNGDGVPEVTLLVWRPFKPWPVDAWLPQGGRIENFHDSRGMSCHIILIGWKQGSYRELWAGSAMANPVKNFVTADLMGNGRQYLVTLEGEYDDDSSAPARRLKVWEWNGFGFTIVNELDGSFNFIGTALTNERQILILSP